MRPGASTPTLQSFCVLLFVVCVSTQTNYQSCSRFNDCTDPDYPICKIYWVDKTFENILGCPKQHGVCVQCQDDCDCGVNQYCGKDFTIPDLVSTNPELEDPQDRIMLLQKNFLHWASESVTGTKIKSKCFEFESREGTCNTYADLRKLPISFLVDGYTNFSSGIVENHSDLQFCGKVDDFIPGLQPSKTHFPGRTEASHPRVINAHLSQTPGTCFRNVFAPTPAGLQDPPELNATLTPRVPSDCGLELDSENSIAMAGLGIRVKSVEPQWQGYCLAGRCKICNDGEMRCGDNGGKKGVPQVCVGNQWIEYMVNDWTFRSIRRNVISEAAISYMVCQCIILLFIILSTIRVLSRQRVYLKQRALDLEQAKRDREAERKALQEEIHKRRFGDSSELQIVSSQDSLDD